MWERRQLAIRFHILRLDYVTERVDPLMVKERSHMRAEDALAVEQCQLHSVFRPRSGYRAMCPRILGKLSRLGANDIWRMWADQSDTAGVVDKCCRRRYGARMVEQRTICLSQ